MLFSQEQLCQGKKYLDQKLTANRFAFVRLEGEIMKKEHKVFQDFLKSQGLKLTKPRLIIFKAIFENKDHFDVENLFNEIHQKHKNVSRATIYRTIPILVEAGIIKQYLRCEAKDHYEHVYGSRKRLHFICDNCGKISTRDCRTIKETLMLLAELEEFKITELNLSVFGLCKDCQKKANHSE
jgi:Fur family ferric uptake transcriptional regulator